MIAQYPGTCAQGCGVPIREGDQIESIASSSPGASRVWSHMICPDPGPTVDELADRAALRNPQCDRCGTHHPGEC